jgi:Leucine-rich repeat (LRR) protein
LSSNIEIFDATTLAGCSNLASLTLDGNRIAEIGERFFISNPNLVLISMTTNRLLRIHDDAFVGTSLMGLNLDVNEIRELPANVFQPISGGLFYLILSANQIENVHEGTFRNLNGLSYLDLSFNGNLQLPENVFNDLIILDILALESCGFSSLSPSWFANLSELYQLWLRGNPVDSLPENVFNSLTNLQYVSLDFMRLSSINSTSFGYSLNSLQTIRARGNNINAIDSRILPESTRINELYLLGNVCIDTNFQQVRDNLDEVRGELSRCFGNF